MPDLDQEYLTKLNEIKVNIQQSDELNTYLEEEEDELYTPLKEKFEPQIEALYNTVAADNPLQLISLERELLNADYEGLFTPRIIGYAVMRGQINERVKYIKPQDHFKRILLSLCNSTNFDVLQLRSGKTIEIGFALSSAIWISNLMNEITNKKVQQYLESLNLIQYRDEKIRLTAYRRYRKQFANFNYLTAEKPESCSDLTLNGESLVNFLVFRAKSDLNNSNLKPFISEIINSKLTECPEFLRVILVIGLYFDLDKADANALKSQWEIMSKAAKFQQKVFREFTDLQEGDDEIDGETIGRLNTILDDKSGQEFNKYLNLIVDVERIGYINDEAAEKIRGYYNNHQGLSLQNEAARVFIFNKFKLFMAKLNTADFQEYFNFNTVFVNYMNIFANEKFNQDLKAILLRYVKSLLRTFSDKRGKDYQEIKKFVQHSFVDMSFMNEKSVKELFKSKRKPKSA